MQFHVARQVYAASITPGPLSRDGSPCSVVVLEHDHEILIGGAEPRTRRLALLGYGLAHAWCLETGEPKDLAGWADLFGTALDAMYADLRLMGGVEALMRLEPGEGPQALAVRVALTTARQCALCTGSVAGGSVVCRPSPALPGVLDLALYCEFCGHVQRWREAASASGLPVGIVLGEPAFERGEAVGRFLRENPAACAGVAVDD